MKVKICKKAGCGRTCAVGKQYCYLHQDLEGQRKVFTYRGKSSKYHYLYETARWKKMSKDFLKKYPICFICGKPAKIADHITPHRGDVNLFFNEDNLQPMCWSCHSRKTFEENNNFNKGKKGNEILQNRRY